ncbi:MAG: HisA/HisF-related TIM barrel protein [Kiritimatiellia bacterium]
MISRLIADAVGVPVVASGGAGKPAHLVTVFREAHADAAIGAGMIHTGDYTLAQIKEEMHVAGVPIRLRY